MIRAVYGGRTVWRGEPHRIGVAEVETQAAKTIPPVPVAAALFCDCPESGPGGRLMGYVTEILPAKMERWILRTRPDAAELPELPVADAAAPVAEAGFRGTPIERLRALSAARTWAALKDAATTVEEIAVMSDEALLALGGIGTRSLNDVRRNCARLLKAEDAGL